MTVSEDPGSTTKSLAEQLRFEGGARDPPLFVTAVLGLLAAVLVGMSTLGALEMGYTAVGVGLLVAIALFVATLAVFEIGRQVGASQ